jgi:hypothetical protein
LHDIDALSFAIPYCHLVITDKQMHSLVCRSEVDERYGTKVIRRLDDLIAELPRLADEAESLPDLRDGWHQVATGVGFDPVSPHELFGITEPDRG